MARFGEERFLMGVGIFDAARDMALVSPPTGLSPEELKRQLFQRFSGPKITVFRMLGLISMRN